MNTIMKNALTCWLSLMGFAIVIISLLLAGTKALANTDEATIVLPLKPSLVERFAAAQLAKYLTAATGMRITVNIGPSHLSDTGILFWVGCVTYDGRLVESGFPVAKLCGVHLINGGVYVDSDGKQTLLVGQGERGALNAVYTYLEDVVGCHWPEPGREYVPILRDWKPPSVHLINNPQFPWRGIAIHGPCTKEYFAKIVDWLAKNRMNAFQVFPGPYEDYRPLVLSAIQKRGLKPDIGGHSREFFLSTAKYRPIHPKWFATDKGKKTDQIDYSDYASVSTYASNVVRFLKHCPEIKIVSLWPNDGYGFSDSKKCKEFPGNQTDLLLAYVNRVAECVHAEVPSVKCEYLAYIGYLSAPLWVKPEPYVVPTFCEHYGSIGARDLWHPITANRAANQVLREQLVKWISLSKQVTEFSYYGDDCIQRFLYHPLTDVVVDDCHYYHHIGLAGNFVLLTNPESWWANALTIYAYAQAAWNAKITPAQIRTDYYESLYGSSAKAMEQYTSDILELYKISPVPEDAMGDTPVGTIDITGKNYNGMLGLYAKWIRRADGALQRARLEAKTAWMKRRLRILQSDTEYLDLWFRIQCGQQHLAVDRSAKLKGQVLELIDKALKLEVITNDDARAYRTANWTLNHASNTVSKITCNLP